MEKKRIGKYTIEFPSKPRIIASAHVVGPKEGNGPLKAEFNKVLLDDKLNEATFEKAERQILSETLEDISMRAQELNKNIELFLGGDLLNQIISTSFSAREMSLPLLGLYSACSTMSESLAVGAALVDGGYVNTAACATVSHFSAAERQYRFPLEQGVQRPPIAQWTVTGAGCLLLSGEGSDVAVTRAVFGEVIDYGVVDVNNMGAAMAPAAMDTLLKFFEDTKESPSDYDLILTGDLGYLGSELLCDLMEDRGKSITKVHQDCGKLIYHKNVARFQGGSGAGCSASVFAAYIYRLLSEKKINKMLFLATGALLSTTSSQQGESIPGISHLVEIVNVK